MEWTMEPEVDMPVLAIVLAVGAVTLLVIGGVQRSKARYLRSAEVTKAGDLAVSSRDVAGEIGSGSFSRLCAVTGTVECASPLTSELGAAACVYYRSIVTREYEETIEERESGGRRSARTRRGSEVVSRNERSCPFILRDETGSVEVDPSGAKLGGEKIVSRFEPAGVGSLVVGSLKLDLGALVGLGGRRTVGYRIEEWAIPLGKRLYVVGEASDAGGSLRLRRPADKRKRFIVSIKDRESLLQAARGVSLGMATGGAILLAGAAILGVLVLLGALQ
jgi:hypothetical protein